MKPIVIRERARRIREVAAGFNDEVSRTLIGLAEGLEIEAAQEEARLIAIERQRGEAGGGDSW